MEPRTRIILDDVTLACALAGEGPLVIAAHGFPDDATTFSAQVPALVAAGFRVACPTMRGYAPSGVPASGRYDLAALGQDLVALADRLSPDAPVRLIGHDWGALAGFTATALAPSRFSHFVTMAVPHVSGFVRNFDAAQLRRSWYIGFFQLPRIAEARLQADDYAFLDRLWRDWSPGYRPSDSEMRAVKDGIAGREREVLGYYRALKSPRALWGESRRLLFSPVRVPTLHLHGADDGCIGAACGRGTESQYRAGFESCVVAGAGHFLQRERPSEVNARLLAFLK